MTTDKQTFEAFVIANCSMSMRAEPRVEVDGEFKYECYDNDDGEEVAFVSWHNGVATYTIMDGE